MDLKHLKENWDTLGSSDPMWAILTNPTKRGNKWDDASFFATGERWIDNMFRVLDEIGVAPAHHDRALDFGCGAGRLTRALGSRFARVDGIDVAPSMIDLARERNAEHASLHFQVNDRADLSVFDDDTFDYIVSLVVFQHMNNDLKTAYLREFVRVLRPGGVIMVTVPSNPRRTLRGLVRRVPNPLQNVYRRMRYGYKGVMEFHPYRRRHVEETFRAAGGDVLHVRPEETAGPDFESFLYVVGKPVRPS